MRPDAAGKEESRQPLIGHPSLGKIQGMPEESQMPKLGRDQHTSHPGLRMNRSDRLPDWPLRRDVQAINEQTTRMLRPLSPGGSPLPSKRKPGSGKPERLTQEFRS